jgi:hypothetical protein
MFLESQRKRRMGSELSPRAGAFSLRRGRGTAAVLFTLIGGLLAFSGWRWLQHRRAEVAGVQTVTVSPGVIYRYLPEGSALVRGTRSDALLLDVDLRTPGIHIDIAAEQVAKQPGGAVVGMAHTVRDWCVQRHALGGINGGFFGKTFGESKEVMGLLMTDGQVRNAGRKVQSPNNPANHFVRAALGFTSAGTPRIGWLTSDRDNGVHAVNQPLNPTGNQVWNLRSALACGPRLIADGIVVITDRQERLVSPRSLPRTFVAYDVEGTGRNARPRHLVLGVGMEMTFADVAACMQRYFRTVHHTECADALCLDGGSSSQLIYHDPQKPLAQDAYIDARPGFVTVPTALLIRRDTP